MAGRGAMGGGGGAASFKDAFFRNFFISLLDASPLIKWDPRDDAIDKSFFMSLLEDRNSNRPSIGMVMAAVIATGNNKDYYSKIHKWIKKQPSAEPTPLICKQFNLIMKLAEYIIKTVSKSDVEYWKQILTDAWYKSPNREDDIWHMIFGNFWPNSLKLSIIGKDSVYVNDGKTATNNMENGNNQVDNTDEATFQNILSTNTSGKKTVGTVLEAIIAAKQNHQRYDKIIKWIGKISPPTLTPALSKQFLHYRKLSDYLATVNSERENVYWGDILCNTEYQLPQDTKDIWPSIFGNAAPNVLTLSFVGKSHVYKKNPVAMPPKKSLTSHKGNVTSPFAGVKLGNPQAPPVKGNVIDSPAKGNTRAPITAPISKKDENEKSAASKPAASRTTQKPAPPSNQTESNSPQSSAKAKTENQQQSNKGSEEADAFFNEEYFNTILKSNNDKTKSVGTVLAAVIAANQKENRYEKIIAWIGKTKPPRLNKAIGEQFLMYRNLSEYLTKSVPAEDTQYWLELLRDTQYQLPLSGTEIWQCIFGKAVPNVLNLSINHKGEVSKKSVESGTDTATPKAEITDNATPKQEVTSVKGRKHIQVALVGDSHIYSLPCKEKETFECEFGSYTLIKYCDKKARPDNFHNTQTWNEFKVSKPNVVILFLGGCNIQKLPNAKSLAGNIIWYEKKILHHTQVRNDRFFVIGIEKRKSSPVIDWRSYRNIVNNQLSNHFGETNFFVFDQEDNEIDYDGKHMNKNAYIRLLECIKDAAISVLQFGEEIQQVDSVDGNANGTLKAEVKAEGDNEKQTPKATTPKAATPKAAAYKAAAPKAEIPKAENPKAETKRKVDDNVQQTDAKKVKTDNNSVNAYNKSPQKRQQQEQGNKFNAKKLATEKKDNSPKVVSLNAVEEEFLDLLNKTVGAKSIGAVLEAVEAAKNDKVRYHHILKWIGVSRFMTPVLEKQLSMYCKLAEYLKEDLPQNERDYWKKTLSETVYQPPCKPMEDVWDNVFGKATPNIHRITLQGKDKIYKRQKPSERVEPKLSAGKINSNNMNQSNTNTTGSHVSKSLSPKNQNIPTKAIPAAVQNSNSKKQITVALIGDSSIALFPGNPTEIVNCPGGNYTLKRFCKTGESIETFQNSAQWKELLGSSADIVLLSLGGDSLNTFAGKQANPRTIADKLLQRRREVMNIMKLPPNCVYLVGLGKKKGSDTYWGKCRTEVNQFLEKVLTNKQFFLPEELQLDAIRPNVNKTVYENLQKFIQQAYNRLKNPFAASTTIQKVSNSPGNMTPGKGQFNKNKNQMSANEKAANVLAGSGDLRKILGNSTSAKQQRSSPIPAARPYGAHEYLKNFAKTQTQIQTPSPSPSPTPTNVFSRLGGIVTNNQTSSPNQPGAGKKQSNRGKFSKQRGGGGAGGQDLRNLIARGQTGRQGNF